LALLVAVQAVALMPKAGQTRDLLTVGLAALASCCLML
jgi:hypothetical protein